MIQAFFMAHPKDVLGKTSKNFKEPSTPTTSTLPTQDVKRRPCAGCSVCLQSAGAALKTEVMPALSRFFKLFRLPDERELNEM